MVDSLGYEYLIDGLGYFCIKAYSLGFYEKIFTFITYLYETFRYFDINYFITCVLGMHSKFCFDSS